MAEVERISISMEPELLARLDELVAGTGHANRSELVRDLIRARLVSVRSPDEDVAGSLTLVYDHHQRALTEKMIGVAHEHDDLVLATLHVHLDHDLCMEVSALRGRRGALQHYAAHVLAMKGVLHGKLVVTVSSAGSEPTWPAGGSVLSQT